MFADLVKSNRSCRRFHQDHVVDKDTLRQLVNLARLSASAANKQPLKYILSSDPTVNRSVFSCLSWAAYLKDWQGPEPDEQPSAYIIILGDTAIASNFGCDHGIAAQTILLGAREIGLAGCMVGAIQKDRLREVLNIQAQLEILLVIAIGKPIETCEIEPIGKDGDIRYWRDEKGHHHVPKRSLDEIIFNIF